MPQEIINGILVTFAGDRREKAAEIVAMLDRLAVRPAALEDKKQESVEVPAILELPISESRSA